jgi:hypothetical protein
VQFLGGKRIDGGVSDLGVVAGVLNFKWPGLTALALLIASNHLGRRRGGFEIIAAVWQRKVVEGEWVLALSTRMSVAFGVLMMLRLALARWPSSGCSPPTRSRSVSCSGCSVFAAYGPRGTASSRPRRVTASMGRSGRQQWRP